MNTLPEKEIITRILKGERHEFSRLVDAYKVPIFNLAFRMTGSGSRQDADDLAQETFLRAYRKLKRFDPEKKFSTWLYTIALNLIRNHLKKRGREMSHETMDRIISEAGRPDIDRMERDLIQSQEIRRMEVCLQKLPADLREAVVLRFYQELSFEDAAEILKISLSAAKMRVYRGLEKLKGMMNERGYRL
jgi:RNA polymerase sigma-70 factor (ECF subfamily)